MNFSFGNICMNEHKDQSPIKYLKIDCKCIQNGLTHFKCIPLGNPIMIINVHFKTIDYPCLTMTGNELYNFETDQTIMV